MWKKLSFPHSHILKNIISWYFDLMKYFMIKFFIFISMFFQFLYLKIKFIFTEKMPILLYRSSKYVSLYKKKLIRYLFNILYYIWFSYNTYIFID